MEVTKYIVGTMQHQYGSRFIRRTHEGWEEVSNTQDRDKTSHSLRFLHKHSNTKSESCIRSNPCIFINQEDTFARAKFDKNQNYRTESHSLAMPKPDLPNGDSFETIDNSNIAIEIPLFHDVWIDQSCVRDDF
jgi:hypothetical protein